MSSPSSPNSWTATIIKPRNSDDLRYLFRSPEGKLIFDQQQVGKLFNIVHDRLDLDGGSPPDASALEKARAFVQVQLGDNLYLASYLRSDGTPQLPEDLQTFWHALQKPNGDWCFVPRSQTTIPDDWPPPGLFNEPQAPATKTTATQITAAPEEPEELEKPEEPDKPGETKQVAEPNANYGNSGDGACTEVSRSEASRSGNFGNSENYPIPEDSNSGDFGNLGNSGNSKPSDILDFLEYTIAEYLVCSPAQRSVLALWILHTYTFQEAHFTPYLNIYSPLEESGKSTCMAILRSLCARPWWAAGVSPAIFKRRVSVGYPTVLLDNWHTVFRGNDKNQFTGFLLNGCDQAHDVATFDSNSEKTISNLWKTFCPKAFAGLESLPPSLARHSIPIVLQRRKPQELVKSAFNLLVPGCAAKLTSWMQRWAKDNEARVMTTFESYELEGPAMSSLSPHQQNCGKVLMALAEAIGGDWPMKAYDSLVEVFEDYNQSQFSPVQLLSDIRDVFARLGNQERIFTAELLEDLHDRDDRAWYEYGKSGKPMTAHALSALLRKHFGIYSRSQRRGEQKLRGYQLLDFQEAWERYPPPPDEACQAERKTCHSEVTATRKACHSEVSATRKACHSEVTATRKACHSEVTAERKACHSEVSAKRVAEEPAPLHSRQSEDAMVSAPQAVRVESTPSTAQEPRQKKTASKPAKSRLVSMSHSNASAEKIRPKATSRLRSFAAKTLRIFTAIWS